MTMRSEVMPVSVSVSEPMAPALPPRGRHPLPTRTRSCVVHASHRRPGSPLDLDSPLPHTTSSPAKRMEMRLARAAKPHLAHDRYTTSVRHPQPQPLPLPHAQSRPQPQLQPKPAPHPSLPLVLLSENDMAALFDEQGHREFHGLRMPRHAPVKPKPRRHTTDHSGFGGASSISTSSAATTATTATTGSSLEVPPRECQICFEAQGEHTLQVCGRCDASFCRSCMRWYIEFKIMEGEVSAKKLVCPAPQCQHTLAQVFIESFVSPEMAAKYRQFLANQRPGVRFCPRAGCCAQIMEPPHSSHRHVHCTSCGVDSCMRCKGDYHKLRTCRRVERSFGKWKTRHNVRACPNCHTDIEKQGGCSHMKCFQCDSEFCWSCLRPWANHDDTLCMPLAFWHSKNRRYGWCTPVRVVTKSVVVSAGAVVVTAGAGLAVLAVPSIMVYQWARASLRRDKYQPRDSIAFVVD